MDITAQLAKDFGNKEYWINIYDDGCGNIYSNRFYCIINIFTVRKLLYRIHVRMK